MDSNDHQSNSRIIFTFQPRYRIFDLSGVYEFAIDYYVVLGKTDNNNELQGPALKVLVDESLLDLPIALKHGYLIFRDLDQDSQPLDFSDLEIDSELRPKQYALVPSRSPSGPSYRDCLKFSIPIDPYGRIAANFTSSHRYKLALTESGRASSVKWCKLVYETSAYSLISQRMQGDDINVSWIKKSTGKAEFKALPSLIQPPEIQVTLVSASPLEFRTDEDLQFTVQITNLSDQAVTALSNGPHRYLSTLDVLYQREESWEHSRITASGERVERHNFSIINNKTKQNLMVHEEPVCRLSLDYNKPLHRSHFTTLYPNTPLVKRGSLQSLLSRKVHLEEGEEYELSIPPLGTDWFWGTIEEAFGSKERQAKLPWNPPETPPLVLASENELKFRISG